MGSEMCIRDSMIFCFIVVCLISMIMAFKTGKKVQAMWMPKA